MPAEAAVSAFGWVEVINLVRHLSEDSATWRSMHPDLAQWATRIGIAHVLSDIFDAVTGFSWLFTASRSKGRPRKPKPYPMPWAKDDSQHFGNGAIPLSEFDSWYYGGD